jgi:CheY-like chemotaxis protein
MPEMDGLTCTKEIRLREKKLGKVEGVPIIALTANILPETVNQCMEAGCTAYQSKPMNISQLQVLLQKYMPGTVL